MPGPTDDHDTRIQLAAALRKSGRLDEAIAIGREIVRLRPDDPEARLQLATSLHRGGRLDEAGVEYEAARRLAPESPRALINYGNLQRDLGRTSEALALYQAALRHDPANADLHSNVGIIYHLEGRIDLAIASAERALALRPDAWQAHSNLLFWLNSHPRSDHGLYQEHLQWAGRHAEPFYPADGGAPVDATRDPQRRLHIGYVSADFRQHPVGGFFAPLLRAHDPQQVEVTCYSDVIRADDMTARLRSGGHGWRNTRGLSDADVANTIRRDRIDVLVDLGGHTGHHRLLVFARRAAPVQVTYLGYPNTTGLATMDWRLTDAVADPVGMTEAHYSERLARIPGGFLCYEPPSYAPPPRAAIDPGDRIMFGSFNNLSKVTPSMIELWARILRGVPHSTLLLKADALGDGPTCDRLRDQFTQLGIEASRVTLRGREPSPERHLAMYHDVDIAFDTFPYHGTTTICEALWMGVPVVTLEGRAHVSRVGTSLLTQVGLTGLIAGSPDEYVDLAILLGRDLEHRRQVSLESLRERVRRSPLVDANRLGRGIESAFRAMWRERCGG